MSTHKADYIIVGLGTAGAVTARYLSDPVHGKYKNSVLVFEAGQNRTDDPIVNEGPAFLFNNFDELNYNPKYAITKLCPEQNFLEGALASTQYSQGRQWFGTSAHNFMGGVRGSSDRWDELAVDVGDSQWSYGNLLAGMKFMETFHGTTTQPAFRGNSGPLSLSQVPPTISPSSECPRWQYLRHYRPKLCNARFPNPFLCL